MTGFYARAMHVKLFLLQKAGAGVMYVYPITDMHQSKDKNIIKIEEDRRPEGPPPKKKKHKKIATALHDKKS